MRVAALVRGLCHLPQLVPKHVRNDVLLLNGCGVVPVHSQTPSRQTVYVGSDRTQHLVAGKRNGVDPKFAQEAIQIISIAGRKAGAIPAKQSPDAPHVPVQQLVYIDRKTKRAYSEPAGEELYQES